ncbi:MAG: hypothetical protein DRJ50_14865 [Actinobacteria bacterium]|nr:MAG: hypothetical protein DRJ50_14865 [Actinomycetota bacterium]
MLVRGRGQLEANPAVFEFDSPVLAALVHGSNETQYPTGIGRCQLAIAHDAGQPRSGIRSRIL